MVSSSMRPPQAGRDDSWVVVLVQAGFENEDVRGGVFGEAVGKYEACGAGADDDEVVVSGHGGQTQRIRDVKSPRLARRRNRVEGGTALRIMEPNG